MKKLIKRLLILLLPIFIPYFGLNFIYMNSPVWKAKYNLGKFDRVPKKIQLATLGSSHTCEGIYFDIPECSDITTFNFALHQQTLDYDYAVIRQYINRMAENSVLLISISQFETNGLPDKNKIHEAELRYIHFLNREYLPPYSFAEFIRNKYLVLYEMKNPLEEMEKVFPQNPITKFKNRNKKKHLVPYYEEDITEYTDEENYESAKSVFNHWVELTKPCDEGAEFNLSYISKIVDLCNDNKVTPIFITCPVTKYVYDYSTDNPKYMELDAFMDAIREKYPDSRYFNYITLFKDRNDYFCDTNHLNRKGAIAFTKHLIRDLKINGIL